LLELRKRTVQYCEMTPPPRYHIDIFWSEEDACWIADVPDLKSCSAHGDTPAEAVGNVQDAIQGWLEVAEERGFPIPAPRYRSEGYAAR
jgi:predicted RNase H-like HicB family nuclease